MSDSGARHTRDSMAAAGMVSRRAAIRAGAIGLMGLGLAEFKALRAAARNGPAPLPAKARSVIYIFLSGGLAQQDSFDLKPDAPVSIRGEFRPIATRTPGIDICEHLPGLAQRSHLWSVCRSMTHSTNGHTLGHYFMLTGRSVKNLGFRGDRQPRPGDYPSILSNAGYAVTHHPELARDQRLIRTACLVQDRHTIEGLTIFGVFDDPPDDPSDFLDRVRHAY